jgi:uncharacterized protein DUF5615
MLRLLADENLDYDLVRGALRRRPALDVVRAQEVGLSGFNDPDILAWAAKETRVVLTHYVKTMIRFGHGRITAGSSMAGLFIVHQKGAALSKVIDDLLLLDDCTDTE